MQMSCWVRQNKGSSYLAYIHGENTPLFIYLSSVPMNLWGSLSRQLIRGKQGGKNNPGSPKLANFQFLKWQHVFSNYNDPINIPRSPKQGRRTRKQL